MLPSVRYDRTDRFKRHEPYEPGNYPSATSPIAKQITDSCAPFAETIRKHD
jgi:hypothetical protein